MVIENGFLPCFRPAAVSYTHLDVYKRQVCGHAVGLQQNLFLQSAVVNGDGPVNGVVKYGHSLFWHDLTDHIGLALSLIHIYLGGV